MKYRLYVLMAALLFSTGGAAIKAVTLTSWQVAGLRSLVAALVLPLLLPEARQINIRRIGPAALAYATTLVLFVLANKLTTAANATFLQATAPFYLLFIGPIFLKEKNRRSDYALGAAIAVGMSLFFADATGAQQLAPNPMAGNILALASGVTWAITVAVLRGLAKSEDSGGSLGVVTLGNLTAFLIALPFAWPLPEIGAQNLAVLGYLGVFQIGLAYICLTRGVKQVPAFETAALVLLEPVMGPVWTYLFHGERPGPLSLAGGVIIVTATLLHARNNRTSL